MVKKRKECSDIPIEVGYTIKSLSRKETEDIHNVFKEYAETPLAGLWNKIFKEELGGCYYNLVHLPMQELANGVSSAKIIGQIEILNKLLDMPRTFTRAMVRIKDFEEKEKKESL